MNQDILIIILSIGFIVLIIFVCVAIGAMIKILLDVRKITGRVRKEADNISETIEVVSNRTKSFFTNSLVIDKIVPALLGIISAGVGYKKMTEKFKDEYEDNDKNDLRNKKKKKSRTKIFTQEEID